MEGLQDDKLRSPLNPAHSKDSSMEVLHRPLSHLTLSDQQRHPLAVLPIPLSPDPSLPLPLPWMCSSSWGVFKKEHRLSQCLHCLLLFTMWHHICGGTHDHLVLSVPTCTQKPRACPSRSSVFLPGSHSGALIRKLPWWNTSMDLPRSFVLLLTDFHF